MKPMDLEEAWAESPHRDHDHEVERAERRIQAWLDSEEAVDTREAEFLRVRG